MQMSTNYMLELTIQHKLQGKLKYPLHLYPFKWHNVSLVMYYFESLNCVMKYIIGADTSAADGNANASV